MTVAGETVTISGTGCIGDDLIVGVAPTAITPGVVTGNVAFTPPVPFGPILDVAAVGEAQAVKPAGRDADPRSP